MTKDELKNKYSSFIMEVSEILGLGKPVDILKLCAVTDSFFQPLKNRIAELEKENAELKAGRNMNVSTKWHDLRENSRLVPDDDRDVINENGFIVHYNAEKQRWFSKGDGLSVSVDVTAWCDIPTYKDKE